MEKAKTEFGLRLQLLRRAAEISGPALSRSLGFGPHLIYNYERGLCEPTLSKLIKIADYFGVSLDRLVGRESFENEKGRAKGNWKSDSICRRP